MTFLEIQQLIATYQGQTSLGVFTINSIDFLKKGILNAHVTAQRAHDFRYAEAVANITVPSSGALLSTATDPNGTSITIAGTLSPNVAGAFTLAGTRNSLPMYLRNVSGTIYFLSYTGTAWQITAGGFLTTAGSWTWTTANTNPAGSGNSYTPATYTGTATATGSTSTIAIKRITGARIDLGVSELMPIELLTDEEYGERIRRQVGRSFTGAEATLDELGVVDGNVLLYQQGQTLYPSPADAVAGSVFILDVIRWMPAYTADTDTDFISEFGGDYLVWQGVLETNKYWRRFAPRQEGNIDEEEIKTRATEALQTLINWDINIARASSTPQEEA